MTSMMFESAYREAFRLEGEALKARALQHAPDWGPPFPDPMQPRVTRKARASIPGPLRAKRNFARRVRMAELPQRLELTGGTGNMMVNICRSMARQVEQDKAARRHGGDTDALEPIHPNSRLDAFGMRAVGDWDNGGGVTLKGGTARQRACYKRAVERYMRAEA